ncbi:hypothetical protein JB92DRAFT_2839039 [Gautieria morchelliformis]|nr:hypothetical protein JB92DRAFT_2839039 [Gautieria morchelliformis]
MSPGLVSENQCSKALIFGAHLMIFMSTDFVVSHCRLSTGTLAAGGGTVDEDDSDYAKDSILPVACTTSMSTLGITTQREYAENVEGTDNYVKVVGYLEDRAAEILHFDKLNNPEKMCQLIELKVQRLEGDADDIRWQVIIN